MNIYCVGLNYVAHTREFKNDVPEEPVIFMKPVSALLENNEPFIIPEWSNNLHYEVELIVKISKTGKNIAPELAEEYFDRIGLGIDFTARDLQQSLRKKGFPWELSKAFDNSAVVGQKFFDINDFADSNAIKFKLKLNGQVVQSADSSMMIFKIERLIAHISKYFRLNPGDLIYTGTPEGVGSVHPDDHLEGFLEDEKILDFFVK